MSWPGTVTSTSGSTASSRRSRAGHRWGGRAAHHRRHCPHLLRVRHPHRVPAHLRAADRATPPLAQDRDGARRRRVEAITALVAAARPSSGGAHRAAWRSVAGSIGTSVANWLGPARARRPRVRHRRVWRSSPTSASSSARSRCCSSPLASDRDDGDRDRRSPCSCSRCSTPSLTRRGSLAGPCTWAAGSVGGRPARPTPCTGSAAPPTARSRSCSSSRPRPAPDQRRGLTDRGDDPAADRRATSTSVRRGHRAGSQVALRFVRDGGPRDPTTEGPSHDPQPQDPRRRRLHPRPRRRRRGGRRARHPQRSPAHRTPTTETTAAARHAARPTARFGHRGESLTVAAEALGMTEDDLRAALAGRQVDRPGGRATRASTCRRSSTHSWPTAWRACRRPRPPSRIVSPRW